MPEIPNPTKTVTFDGATRRLNTVSGNPVWMLHTSAGDFRTENDAQVGGQIANHLSDSTDSYVGKSVVLTLLGRSRRVIGIELAE